MSLDKLSKSIILYLSQQSNPSEATYDFSEDIRKIAKEISSDYESVRSAIRFLESQGYIKYVYTSPSHKIVAFFLDHKGLHQKEIHRKEWFARHAFDLFNLLMAIAAIVISVVALIRT